MKNKDLIAALQQFPDDMEVAILDWQKNSTYDDGDGSSEGIYPWFKVEKIEAEPGTPAHEDMMLPYIALSFINEDYSPESGSLINMVPRRCRVCGCTDHDCRQCIEKTGEPCHWVEQDLCSACQETQKSLKNIPKKL